MTREKLGGKAEAFRVAPELEAIERELDIYESLLKRWQSTINLVSQQTLASLWLRHFADSAQVHAALPHARQWVDLGSGGGFPGLVTALLLKGVQNARVHLIESDQRKAAFLRAVSRETGAPAEVHANRIEQVVGALAAPDAFSARALAPLSELLLLAEPLLRVGATGVFLKGEDWRAELTQGARIVNVALEAFPSKTNARAAIVVVKPAEQGLK